MCVCMRVFVYVRVCVCVCWGDRAVRDERERMRDTLRQRTREGDGKRERAFSRAHYASDRGKKSAYVRRTERQSMRVKGENKERKMVCMLRIHVRVFE